MAKTNNLLFEVEINHLCWVCDVTERNKDTYTRCTPSLVKNNTITNIVELHSPTTQKDISFIKQHPQVKRADIIVKKPDVAFLKVVSKYDAMTLKVLHQTKVALLESPVTKDGLDGELLLAPSFKEMRKLLKLWNEQKGFYDVKLKSKRYLKAKDTPKLDMFGKSGFCELSSAKEMLTKKQMKAFKLASDYGYYEVPKKISIEELAAKLGISIPTFAEHLRKAESKLLPILSKVLMGI